MTMTPPKTQLQNMAFGLLTAVLILTALEGLSWAAFEVLPPRPVLSIEDHFSKEEPPPGHQQTAQTVRQDQAIHPFLGYVLDPDHHSAAREPGRNPEAIAHGFPRNRHPIFHTPRSDQLVIGIFGGSVASILANNAHRMGRKLPHLQRFAGRKLVLVNLATGGFKQPQQLMTLAYFLSLGAHFDIVLNLDGFNDIALATTDNVDRGMYPFYPRHWDFRVSDLDPERRRRQGQIAYFQDLRTERAERFSRAPWYFHNAARFFGEIADRRLGTRIHGLQRKLLDSGSVEGGYQAHGPPIPFDSRQELLEGLAELWQRSSRQMHHLATGLGIEYHHFLQPNQYLPDSKPLSSEELDIAWKEDYPHRQLVIDGYPLLRQKGVELQNEGIAFHDLAEIFAEEPRTVYNDTCCHLNLFGNGLLAAAILEALETPPETL